MHDLVILILATIINSCSIFGNISYSIYMYDDWILIAQVRQIYICYLGGLTFKTIPLSILFVFINFQIIIERRLFNELRCTNESLPNCFKLMSFIVNILLYLPLANTYVKSVGTILNQNSLYHFSKYLLICLKKLQTI